MGRKRQYFIADHVGFMKYSLNKPDYVIEINGIIFFPDNTDENVIELTIMK